MASGSGSSLGAGAATCSQAHEEKEEEEDEDPTQPGTSSSTQPMSPPPLSIPLQEEACFEGSHPAEDHRFEATQRNTECFLDLFEQLVKK